ncbi:alpha-amylase family glycosyl hydrolase [Desulfurococcus mucosus]|uniref:Alpha amylase catalytic region n=1 Tax=Desulfurococcus mucosus (strain ATCC 35584 / DSM 2162 / JCM 9187 / O7/1) TaxID=765177 RepID=E8R829_DESM0|nr:alpha-amylase family glycosyl hydrolase [Desulfurococcus mucosus]ADV64655.1 alpha amylase catalytic region [Desulfurococcus mucosus DSM 2162]
MYRVLGRETIGRGRFGRYLVEYSVPWPSGARRVYLIGVFSGWFPGHLRLRRVGDRGRIVLKLWPGEYHYGFSVNSGAPVPDPENPDIVESRPFYDWRVPFRLSRSIVKASENPVDDVVHAEDEEAFLHRFLDTLVVRIRVPRGLDKPRLIVEGEGEYKPAVEYVFRDAAVYEYHLQYIGSHVYKYRFLIRHQGVDLYYGDEGIAMDPSPIVVESERIPGISEAEWYMGAVYYQVFPDSFDNGDPGNDPPVKVTRVAPREPGYYGGDIQGIIRRLNHIVGLGVDALYLTPIFQAATYHRYDIYDFTSVDRYLGSMDDFKRLVDELHKRGVKLVLDVTLHHTSPCFHAFVKALREGPGSPYWDWYLFKEEPPRGLLHEVLGYLEGECRSRELEKAMRSRGLEPFYESFFNLWSMPKLNHENPEVLDYFMEVTRYWAEKGVDGFRIDVALGIPYTWLMLYYKLVKDMRSDFLLLGELNDYPAYYTGYFDSVMDYYWRKIVFSKIIDEGLSMEDFIGELNREYSEIPHYKAISLYHSLGTHDTPRVMTYAGGDTGKVKLLFTLLFTLPGSPAIYYGDEVGMEGGGDPDNRRPMTWDEAAWNMEVYMHVKKMISLYKAWASLRLGFYSATGIDDDVVLIKRWIKGEEVYVLANLSRGEKTVEPGIPEGVYVDLVSGEEVYVGGGVKLTLGGYGFRLLGRRCKG